MKHGWMRGLAALFLLSVLAAAPGCGKSEAPPASAPAPASETLDEVPAPGGDEGIAPAAPEPEPVPEAAVTPIEPPSEEPQEEVEPAEEPAPDPDPAPETAAPVAAVKVVPAGQPVEVAFVSNNASDFWTIARAGTQKAAEELGVKVQFRIPAAGTAEEQQQIVQDLVTTGVSGIAISPKDPVNQTAMLNEAAAKVNLITQDSDAPGSNRICYVGTNNYEAGREAGKLVQQCVPAGLPIMVCVGTLDAQNASDRLKGLEDQLKSTEHFIKEIRTDETDRAKAISNVEDALVRHPEIACYVGLWSYNGPAILNAVKAAGRHGVVHIVAFDEEEETLQGIKDGFIFGTVVQRPYEFGYQSVALLKEFAAGDTSKVPAGRQIFVPTLSVTAKNIDAFRAELKALLGR